jgi:hypothetical protein
LAELQQPGSNQGQLLAKAGDGRRGWLRQGRVERGPIAGQLLQGRGPQAG